jgi:hypothetical protein
MPHHSRFFLQNQIATFNFTKKKQILMSHLDHSSYFLKKLKLQKSKYILKVHYGINYIIIKIHNNYNFLMR